MWEEVNNKQFVGSLVNALREEWDKHKGKLRLRTGSGGGEEDFTEVRGHNHSEWS